MPPRSAKKGSAKKTKKKAHVEENPSPVLPPDFSDEKDVSEAAATTTTVSVEGNVVEMGAPPAVCGEEQLVGVPAPAEEKDVEMEEIKVLEAEVAQDTDVTRSTEEEKATVEEEGKSTKMTEIPTIESVKEAENVEVTEVSPSKAPEGSEDVKATEVIDAVKENDDGFCKVIAEQGIEQKFTEAVTVAAKVEDTEGHEAVISEAGDGMDNGDRSLNDEDSDHEENEEEEDPSIYIQTPPSEGKKQKEFEIFVGGLDKEAVEDDLVKVFSAFGEIQSARVVKHPVTQKSKGFAFIQYSTVEQTKKALFELKDGIEIKGKRVGVSASVDNDTLYMGNICKTWTKDHVLETLKSFGVEQIEEILLPGDPKNEGKIKGFALLEFSSHSDAMAAFQRLQKADAIFGCDRSARVAFAQSSIHPSEEALSKVKTVFIEGLPLSWDEAKVKELCKQYGEIEKVQLSQNFTKNKRKDYGFVSFISREGTVACIEGINNAQLGEGDLKVKANLAKPQNKGRLANQGARGGFKVKKDGDTTEEAGQSKLTNQAKPKKSQRKRKVVPKFKDTERSKQIKYQGNAFAGKNKIQQSTVVGGKQRNKDKDTNSTRPSKKARYPNLGNFRGRPSNVVGNQNNTFFGKPQSIYPTQSTIYASGYAVPGTSYQAHAYAGSSGVNNYHSHLEPHAGLLPTARKGQDAYEYTQRSGYVGQANIGVGFTGGSVPQSSYPGSSSYAGYKAGYIYPSSGAYAPQRRYY